jgi:hypothetical protein
MYDFTAVYFLKSNTADTKAKHTNTLTGKKIFQEVSSLCTPIE